MARFESAILALLVMATPCQAGVSPPLQLIDIGTLGGSESYVVALNEAGQVIGSSYTSGDAESHAFIWEAAHGMQDLGTLGGSFSMPVAINDAGQVIGYSSTHRGGPNRAFIWDKQNGMRDLGTLGGTGSSASAINSDGQVIGAAATAGDRKSVV